MIVLAMMLFGLNLDPLYEAIAEVESTSGKRSANVYQISTIYLRDVNRILRFHRYTFYPPFRLQDINSPSKSRDMMLVYWKFYGDRYLNRTGKNPSYEVLARLHNGGPFKYEMRCTFHYWHKVRQVLDRKGINY